jgi:S-DNA-T family DNA segregation ATPase FtsK/SpoIIIE
LARKKTRSKNRSFRLSELKKWAEDQTVRLAIGLFLCFAGLFLAGAFLSYLFHWRTDLSELSGSFAELLDPEHEVINLFGKLGAAVAHTLIYRGFGLASFCAVYLLIRLGSWAILDRRAHLGRDIRYALYALGWGAVALSGFSISGFLPLGGMGGRNAYSFLTVQLGPVGVHFLIYGLLVVFSTLHFRWTLPKLRIALDTMLSKTRKAPKGTEENGEAEGKDALEEDVVVEWEETEDKDQETEKATGSNISVEVEEPEQEPEVVEPSAKEQEADTDDNLVIEIEETEQEEELDVRAHKKLIKEVGYYDPKLDLGSFKMPGLDLMKDYGNSNITIDQDELDSNKKRIVDTLAHYKIAIDKIKATIGPTVTLYEIIPAPGVRISKIKNLEDDIALSLSAEGIRIIAPIPGRGTIGIEVPNAKPKMVAMRTVLASEKFTKSDHALPIVIGKTISNETYVTDLAKMPHLLMAGATGQGKSVGLNVILTSLLYRKHPSEVKFVLVDPKKVELTLFNVIERHYLAEMPGNGEAIITDTTKVIHTLNSLCIEMDQRYELLKNAMVRNIKEYNTKFKERKLNPEEGHRYLPYIVLVVDEFADLIMTAGKEVETPIARLAQLARAIGIHLIIATQRPSVNVITGIIKANFPARIAFRVTSKIDSRTIMDAGGAERLIGKGDMLISLGNEAIRLQCAFVDTPEIEKLVEYIGAQRGYPTAYQLPEYEAEESSGTSDIDPADRDAMFEEAARLIVIHQQGSASLLQRKLKLGYNRAGRIIDQLEAAGIIGPFEGSKARQVLVPDELSLEQILKPDA